MGLYDKLYNPISEWNLAGELILSSFWTAFEGIGVGYGSLYIRLNCAQL